MGAAGGPGILGIRNRRSTACGIAASCEQHQRGSEQAAAGFWRWIFPARYRQRRCELCRHPTTRSCVKREPLTLAGGACRRAGQPACEVTPMALYTNSCVLRGEEVLFIELPLQASGLAPDLPIGA